MMGCQLPLKIPPVLKPVPSKNILKVGQMLKIRRAANGEVVFTVSGCMDAENIGEMKSLFQSEEKGRRITLDLRDLTLVDQAAVSFLERCEADGVRLENCPAYIREWIRRDRRGS